MSPFLFCLRIIVNTFDKCTGILNTMATSTDKLAPRIIINENDILPENK